MINNIEILYSTRIGDLFLTTCIRMGVLHGEILMRPLIQSVYLIFLENPVVAFFFDARKKKQ